MYQIIRPEKGAVECGNNVGPGVGEIVEFLDDGRVVFLHIKTSPLSGRRVDDDGVVATKLGDTSPGSKNVMGN